MTESNSPTPGSRMRFAAALVEETAVSQAAIHLSQQIQARLDGQPPDVVFVFPSAYFQPAAAEISEILRASLQARVIIGATAEGVVGSAEEVERRPAISVLAACLPDVGLTPFAINGSRLHDDTLDSSDLFRLATGAPPDTRAFIVFGDPYSTPIDPLLGAFHRDYAGVPVVGGMASGALRPRGHGLILNESVYNSGAVGLAISGEIAVDVVVSQGCRPVGRTMPVTQGEQNAIMRLDDAPPIQQIEQLYNALSDEDRGLLQKGLYLGRAVARDEDGDIGRGDFLIRSVMGIERASGAMIVGDIIPTGDLVQFHLRDAVSAAEDLDFMLLPHQFGAAPAGGLLFTCNGRGSRLYDQPNGDIGTINAALGEFPLAGFFAGGELGPVGGRSYLHGQTASLMLFRPPE